MHLNSENVVTALRETGGDLRQSTLRRYFGGAKADVVARRLNAMGLVECVGTRGARRLRVTVDEAEPVILQIDVWHETQPRTRRRDRGKVKPNMTATAWMVLLHDPGRLFEPGAQFPAHQVLPGEGEEPDAWYIGTRFEYRYRDKRRVYVYDGERLRLVKDAGEVPGNG